MGLKLHIPAYWCGCEGAKRSFPGAEDMCWAWGVFFFFFPIMAKRSGSQYPHIRLEILLIKHILYMFNMFIYVYKDINVYNMYMCINIYIYMFMYIKHINVYKHICVYKHIYMFIYVYIYIYSHITVLP